MTAQLSGTDSPGDIEWRARADELIALLQARGLTAVLGRHHAVLAHNLGSEQDTEDLGRHPGNPGLRQEVRAIRRNDGTLWWSWAWSGASRQDPPELEPLCPIDQTRKAADRITAVLAVRFTAAP